MTPAAPARRNPGAEAPSILTRMVAFLASTSPRRRVRLLQWLIASLVYAGAGVLLAMGRAQGWMSGAALAAWATYVGVVLLAGYVALRSGWSERFRDPALTIWQLSLGVVAVNWGYLICGPMRTSALFPLMVIFAFGAFSLRWREIAFLTCLAVASLGAAILVREHFPHLAGAEASADPLLVDLNNLLMILVVLPALAVIAVRLSSLRQTLRDQRAALAGALAEVERLATRDELTALANRRSVMETLARSAAMAARLEAAFCVALLDIDHFKRINDECGHAAGDEVLRAFARAATAATRDTDIVGRWGGEEFLVVLPGLGVQAAATVVRRLQQAVCGHGVGGRALTFSAGVTAHRRGEDVATMLARADAALYAAKHAGRNRVVVSPPA